MLAGTRRVAWVLPAALLVLAGLIAPPAVAAPPPEPASRPWQMRHWPQTQPWQQAQPAPRGLQAGGPPPIDPQNFELPDTMTWEDYRQVPGTTWADPAAKGSVRTFKGALVLVDYPNQPFVVTQPANSTVYGNPSAVHDLPRAEVPEFYRNFLNTPGRLNRGHTIHEYWMEDSGGRFGIELGAFGVYQVPGKSHEYGVEASMQGGQGCPSGDTCQRNLRTDARAAWLADVGPDTVGQYDFVFYLSAGQDESSTWQEFGEMKFATRQDVTAEFGSPDPTLARWNKTRYVDWTSWQAASNLWPNAGGGSSIQAESSGMSVYAHEFSHIVGIADNYNDPFAVPIRRAYSGPWEMLDRGTFNGPGGPHSRWLIPATAGASMGAQHMLRNKLKLGIVDERNVLRLSRGALAGSGVVVARVNARSSPAVDGLAGVNLALDGGDRSPVCRPSADPLCDGGGYHNYTVEVVDRRGFDSFTPDSGVLLAKTKNVDAAPFIWTIDANPQDIAKTDFVRPDGTPQPITVADYRQLSDALLHAGTDSGSEYEYVDEANRLHFYVVDARRDAAGLLSYTVAVRSLDGAGPQRRGVTVARASAAAPPPGGWVACNVPVRNTGQGGPVPPGHPEDVTPYLGSDVYRLSVAAAGAGWTARLPSTLATAEFGKTVPALVYVQRGSGAAGSTDVRVTVTSESDPTKTAIGTCHIA